MYQEKKVDIVPLKWVWWWKLYWCTRKSKQTLFHWKKFDGENCTDAPWKEGRHCTFNVLTYLIQTLCWRMRKKTLTFEAYDTVQTTQKHEEESHQSILKNMEDSRQRTFEACLTVDKRWAMTMTVRLFMARSMASFTKCSLSASSALVACHKNGKNPQWHVP